MADVARDGRAKDVRVGGAVRPNAPRGRGHDETGVGVAPLYLIATINPVAEHVAQVDRILRGMMDATRREPGCELYDLVVDPDAPDAWLMIEKWTSRAHWEAHMSSEHNVRGNAELTGLLRAPTTLRILDEKAP